MHCGEQQRAYLPWKTWELGTPQAAAEITSPSDRPEGPWQDKLERYHELGVHELVRHRRDQPAGQRLQIWDRVDENLLEREVEGDLGVSNVLGLYWSRGGRPEMGADELQQELSGGSNCQPYQTWLNGDDQLPINCVTWYEASAFCIWDGGRLPTEAEWEYAAAGGDENRPFPWGSSPAPASSLANYSGCRGAATPVGSHASGPGRWGHMDLAGNLTEWVLDSYSSSWYSSAEATGADAANVPVSPPFVARGGDWNQVVDVAHSAYRSGQTTQWRPGFRCARTP